MPISGRRLRPSWRHHERWCGCREFVPRRQRTDVESNDDAVKSGSLLYKNRKRLSVSCYFLAPCDKRKHTAHAHQQAASQASMDSAWRHPMWLPHSSLGFQRPVGRRSYHNKPRLTVEVCVQSAGISLPMYTKSDCSYWACAMTVSKLMYAWCQLTQWDVPDCDDPGAVGLRTLTRICSITQTDATSHNRASRGLYNLYDDERHSVCLTLDPIIAARNGYSDSGTRELLSSRLKALAVNAVHLKSLQKKCTSDQPTLLAVKNRHLL